MARDGNKDYRAARGSHGCNNAVGIKVHCVALLLSPCAGIDERRYFAGAGADGFAGAGLGGPIVGTAGVNAWPVQS